MAQPNPELPIGKLLRQRYRLKKRLGAGGFGETYLAVDQDLPNHPPRVVKRFLPQAILALPADQRGPHLLKAKEWFDREAHKLYELGQKSSRIPTLFAYFQEGGEFYLVMEFFEGRVLAEEVVSAPVWSETQVVSFLVDVLSVLAKVHRAGVVHRDIKPQNLMRLPDGRVALIDFGAVKEVSAVQVADRHQIITSTAAIGTPGYMPPEQAQGRPCCASDVYAAGATAIQALTGVWPGALPHNDRLEIQWRDRANVSDRLAEILTTMTRCLPADRYRDAEVALEAIVAAYGLAAPESPPAANPIDEIRTRRVAPAAPTMPDRPPKQRGFRTAIKDFFLAELPPAVPAPKPRSPAQPPAQPQRGASPQGLRLQPFQVAVVKLDDRGREISVETVQRQKAVVMLPGDVPLEMVQIPAGKFLMGSPENEAERDSDEGPQHEVSVPDFFMGRYPVTQAQWRAIAGLGKVKLDLKPEPSYFKGPRRPVEGVSWLETLEFCARLSTYAKTRNLPLEFRLPTEAEWEYACRAGTTTPFHFGPTLTDQVANYGAIYTYGNGPKGKYRQETTEVGFFQKNEQEIANRFGLVDMHGNVYEWCLDWWFANYDGAPKDGRARRDKNNHSRSSWTEILADWKVGKFDNEEGQQSWRLLRGGSWNLNPKSCRSAFRDGSTRDRQYDHIGFRVLLPRTI